MRALDKQSLIADRAAVLEILDSIPEDDELGRISFSERLAEIEAPLARYGGDENDHTGRVALIFDGDPVRGSRSVDAVFAGNALKTFQDLVSKRLAVEVFGELGARGPVPLRSRANLAVSNIVRGSVGFDVEEAIENEELADTAIKKAIDDVTSTIQKTAASDVAAFDEAIASLDHGFLVSLRAFFHNLDDSGAQVRIVDGGRDMTLDSAAVRRGRERVDNTEIDDREDDSIVGELLGLLQSGDGSKCFYAMGRPSAGPFWHQWLNAMWN